MNKPTPECQKNHYFSLGVAVENLVKTFRGNLIKYRLSCPELKFFKQSQQVNSPK